MCVTHAVALAKLPHCVQENSLLLVNALMLRALQLPSPVSACALHTELLALHLPEVRLPKLQAAAAAPSRAAARHFRSVAILNGRCAAVANRSTQFTERGHASSDSPVRATMRSTA